MSNITQKQAEAHARVLFTRWLKRNMVGMDEMDREAAWHCMPDEKRASWIEGARKKLEEAA